MVRRCGMIVLVVESSPLALQCWLVLFVRVCEIVMVVLMISDDDIVPNYEEYGTLSPYNAI